MIRPMYNNVTTSQTYLYNLAVIKRYCVKGTIVKIQSNPPFKKGGCPIYNGTLKSLNFINNGR